MLGSKLHLDIGETVIHEVRKHWFVFFVQALSVLVLALLPAFILMLGAKLLPLKVIPLMAENSATITFVYFLWLLVLWIIFFIQWTNYFLDVWHITEKRIIDIEQKNLFHREVSNLRFDKIQDVTVEVRGLMATIFKYGDIRVQTAAENSSTFVMKNATHPEKVRQLIFSRHNREAEKVMNHQAHTSNQSDVHSQVHS